ncbi:MAG: hypothetical protein ABI041_10920, partial [Bdellovibrionia bacterium]
MKTCLSFVFGLLLFGVPFVAAGGEGKQSSKSNIDLRSSAVRRLSIIADHFNPPKLQRSKSLVDIRRPNSTPPDKEKVAGKMEHIGETFSQRQEYKQAVKGLNTIIRARKEKGLPFTDQTARVLHGTRNELKKDALEKTDESIRELIKDRNLKVYKNTAGPTFNYLRNVKRKTNEEIAASAARSNGKDISKFKKEYLERSYSFPQIKRDINPAPLPL